MAEHTPKRNPHSPKGTPAERRAAAWAELQALCDGGKWRMSIPVRDGEDSDTIFAAALHDADKIEAQRDELVEAASDAADRLDMIARLLNHDPTPERIQEAYNLAYSGVQHAALARARGEPEGTTQ